ncbi:uncharacterized protein LOC143592200 [Bidens hawaiensis]|uniref:uncharacterized protein LOC143592200 n=1 Tax=Bidens hawaiensis TaxID=980011 RepID=UPI00404904D5
MVNIGGSVTPKMSSRLLDNSEVTKMSVLDVSTLDATIKVRIVKLWKLPSFKHPNTTHAVELILMDEEGTKIQETVMNAYLSKHERFLVHKECVLIQKFAIGDSLSTYQLTNHPHKLFLNDNYVVKRCNDPIGSLYGFSLIDFEMLLNNSLTQNSVVDIIG